MAKSTIRPVPTREDVIEAMKMLSECYKSDMSHADYKKTMQEKGFDWTRDDLAAFENKYGAVITGGSDITTGCYSQAMGVVVNSVQCDDFSWNRQKAVNASEWNIKPEKTADKYLKWATDTEKQLESFKEEYAKNDEGLPFDYYMAYKLSNVNTPPGVTCDEWWEASRSDPNGWRSKGIPSKIEENMPYRKLKGESKIQRTLEAERDDSSISGNSELDIMRNVWNKKEETKFTPNPPKSRHVDEFLAQAFKDIYGDDFDLESPDDDGGPNR